MNKFRIFFVVGSIVSFFLMSGFLSQIRADTLVSATLDKTEGTLEDYFHLKISVQGKSSGSPQIPYIAGLEVEAKGTSQQVQIVNGKISREMQYNYLVRAKREGLFVIPSITVKSSGPVTPSELLEFRVKKSLQTVSVDKKIFLQAEISKKKAYLGEQLTYTMQFFRRINTTSARLQKPDFNGFVVEELGKQKDSERIISGKRYAVTELRFALFPVEEGQVKISPARISYEALLHDPNDPFSRFGFFSAGMPKRGEVSSEALSVQVKPIPVQGRSQGFSGLVGQFKLESKLPKKHIAVGESVTLTLTLAGMGNVRQMPDLNWAQNPEFRKNFKVYDDKPQLTIRPTDSGLIGKKVFKKALVPLKGGSLRIPSLRISYFDPKQENFVSLKTQEFLLEVDPSLEEEGLVVSQGGNRFRKKGVKILGEDLMPVHTKLRALKNYRMTNTQKMAMGAAGSLPPFAFFLLWFIRQKQEHLERNVDLVKRKKAYSKVQKAMKEIEKLIPEDSKRFYAEMGKHIRLYIGEKLSIAGIALTSDEASQKILSHGIRSSEGKKMKMLLDQCERAQFGQGKFGDEREFLKETKEFLKHLEKNL